MEVTEQIKNEQRELLTASEAAAMLRTTVGALNMRRLRGLIPMNCMTRAGSRRWLYKRRELEKWLIGQELY